MSAAFPGTFAEISPMLAVVGSIEDVDDEHWAFEGKWDGVRGIASLHEGTLSIRSRIGHERLPSFPQLGALRDVLTGHEAVLDGEIVALDDAGVTNFQLLENGGAPRYFVYDVLWLDGVDLRGEPYDHRREVLEALGHSSPGLEVPAQLTGGAAAAVALSKARHWEGVMAKRRSGIYHVGKRSTDWFKLKNWHSQEVVLGGFTAGEGARAGLPGALLLGVHTDAGALEYVGKVGTGFTDRDLRELAEAMAPLVTDAMPFVDAVPHADAKNVTWLRPTLVGEVRFSEWTAAHRLRHPSWRGLRDDKTPEQVRREPIA